jgi:Fe2+ transport system protein B
LDDGARENHTLPFCHRVQNEDDETLISLLVLFFGIFSFWFQVVNPYTKYALTMTPVALSIEEALPKKMQSYLVGMLVRTCLVLSTVAVALLFPYFGE